MKELTYNMDKREKAMQLFLSGYNCSQAVIGAFAEDIGLEFDIAVRLASSFGGGMGRLREVCGTVSAMFMIIGLKLGYDEPGNFEKKTAHYKLVQEAAAKFREKNGSIVCRELLGLNLKPGEADSFIPKKRTKEYYKKRPCVKIVGDAAEICENILLEHKI